MPHFRLALQRHGQVDGNALDHFVGVTDESLNARGRQEVARAARFLHRDLQFEPQVIYCSPLQRATQTAAAFSEVCHAPVVVEPLLRERNYGIFDGLAKAEIAQRWPEYLAEYNLDKTAYAPPEGEHVSVLEARVHTFLYESLPTAHPQGGNILIVTHLNPVRAILVFLGLAERDVYRRKFRNASVTIVDTDLVHSRLEHIDAVAADP
jgi:broad specificity phosphatase PhoE